MGDENFGQVGSAFIALEADIASFRDSLRQATPALERLAGQAGKAVGDAFSGNIQLKNFGEQLKNVGDVSQRVGAVMTASLTVPLVAIGGLALKTGIEFESAFAGVKKTIEATPEQLEKIRQGILDMAAEIPVAATELAKIGETAGQLGIATEDIEEFTRTIAGMATATNLSTDEAATSIAQFAKIMGATADQFKNIGSAIVGLGNESNATESQIVDMALRLAGAGKQIGLTQAQVLGFATSLSSVGIQAELGGTAFSRLFLEISKAVALGGDSLAGFAKVALPGVSGAASQFAERFKTDAAGAIADFIKGLQHISNTGGSVILTLEDLGIKQIQLTDAINRSVGAGELLNDSLKSSDKFYRENIALEKEVAERYKTTESQLKLLRNQVELLGIELFKSFGPILRDTVIPILKDVGGVAKSAAEAFTRMPAEVQKAVIALGGLLAIAGPVAYGFGSFVGNIGLASIALSKFVPPAAAAGEAAAGAGMAASVMGTAMSVASVVGVTALGAALGLLVGHFLNATVEALGLQTQLDSLIKTMVEVVPGGKSLTGTKDLSDANDRLTESVKASLAALALQGVHIDTAGKSSAQLSVEITKAGAVTAQQTQSNKDAAAAAAKLAAETTNQAVMSRGLEKAVVPLTDAQKKLAQSFTDQLYPASKLEVELQTLIGWYGQTAVVAAYRDQIIAAGDAEKQHGTALVSSYQALYDLANASKDASKAKDDLATAAAKATEEQKKLNETAAETLKPADELNVVLGKLSAQFSQSDIVAIYGQQILQAAEAQRQHGYAVTGAVALLEGLANQSKMSAEAIKAMAESQETFKTTLAESVEPANVLNKTIGDLVAKFGASAVVEVYAQQIVDATKKQRDHGLAVTGVIATLEELAVKHVNAAKAADELTRATARNVEEQKRLKDQFLQALKPADDLEITLNKLTDVFSREDIIKVYGDQIISATEKQREHGFAISDNIKLLEQMAITAKAATTAAVSAEIAAPASGVSKPAGSSTENSPFSFSPLNSGLNTVVLGSAPSKRNQQTSISPSSLLSAFQGYAMDPFGINGQRTPNPTPTGSSTPNNWIWTNGAAVQATAAPSNSSTASIMSGQPVAAGFVPNISAGIQTTGLSKSASEVFAEAVDKLIPALSDFTVAVGRSAENGGAMGTTVYLTQNFDNDFNVGDVLTPATIRDVIIPEVLDVFETGVRGYKEKLKRIVLE